MPETDYQRIVVLAALEQERLDTQLPAILKGQLDADELYELRDDWQEELGFEEYAKPLIAALHRIAEDMDEGEYDSDAYAELELQHALYKAASWEHLQRAIGAAIPDLEPEAYVGVQRYDKLQQERVHPYERGAILRSELAHLAKSNPIKVNRNFKSKVELEELFARFGLPRKELLSGDGSNVISLSDEREKRR